MAMKKGHAMLTPGNVLATLADRFQARVDRSGPGCWKWNGTHTTGGYGMLHLGYLAHRIAYEVYRGPIPEGFNLDHLCRNRGCVNPAHLEAVSHRENCMRGDTVTGRNARKKACSKGHAFDVTNTIVRPSGRRGCRACAKFYNARWRRQKHQKGNSNV